MRKFILIAAIALASASAQAGEIRETRNLTLAASDEPAAIEQAKPVETLKTEDQAVETAKPAETPKFVDRPSVVTPAAEAPKADVVNKADIAKTDAAKPVATATPKADKPKRRHYWTEARIIGELHRHGIYW
jgi:hypothetical protein